MRCREMRPACPLALPSQPGLLVQHQCLCLCRRHGASASREHHFLPSSSSRLRLLVPFITLQPGLGKHLLNESEGDPGKKQTSADRMPQSRGRPPTSIVDPSSARLVQGHWGGDSGHWGSRPPRPHALMLPGAPVTVPTRQAGVPALLKCERCRDQVFHHGGFLLIDTQHRVTELQEKMKVLVPCCRLRGSSCPPDSSTALRGPSRVLMQSHPIE